AGSKRLSREGSSRDRRSGSKQASRRGSPAVLERQGSSTSAGLGPKPTAPGCTGIMCDYIERQKAKEGKAHVEIEDWFLASLLESSMINGDALENVKGLLYREQLYDVWMGSIVDECKEMGLFPKTPPDRFKQQASHIVQMKHSATLMNVEVDN
ncbi:unnamed protein product, partial [Polarella glacialis]